MTTDPHDVRGPLVTVSGEIDLSNASRLREALAALGAPARSIVDLSGVAFMDSTGLAALAYYRNTVRRVGGEVYLVVTAPFLRHMFNVTKLNHEFKIVERLGDVAAPS